MHRPARISIIAMALTAIALPLLLAACSQDAAPTAPATDDAAAKRAPYIQDPTDPLDSYIFNLAWSFQTLEFQEVPIALNTSGDLVTVSPRGYAPFLVEFTPNPAAAAILGADMELPVSIAVPVAPAVGYLSTPGNSILYRTKNFPSSELGSVKLSIPIMGFYDMSNYNGTFMSYSLHWNSKLQTGTLEDQVQIVVPEWPLMEPDPVVYVTVDGIDDKDQPSSATDRILDPLTIGDEL